MLSYLSFNQCLLALFAFLQNIC